MRPKDADGMANSVVPDQTCLDLSVRNLRIITVLPEVPELLRVRIKSLVSPGIRVSATVTKPHVKAGVGKKKPQALIDEIVDPVGGTRQKAML